MSEFRMQKYRVMFDQLDHNRNDRMDFDDFSGHAHMIKKEQGWADDHEHFTRLIEAKKKFWKELNVRVKPAEDTITFDEWKGFCDGLATEVKETGRVPDWVTRIHYLLFESLDLDGDGIISKTEYALYLKSIGSDVDPKKIFPKLDLDGNGHISLDELEELFSQWLISDDPKDPGNYLLAGKV